MLRVAGGIHRSRQLCSPPGQDTRPTRSLVREAVFSMLMNEVPGSRVLDLFAGSGAMGLEAISRGAAFSVFCDLKRQAVDCVKKNIDLLRVSGQSRVLMMSWEQAVKQLADEDERFNLIFLDPPYKMESGIILSAIAMANLLEPGGTVVLETGKEPSLAIPEDFVVVKEKSYGETVLKLIELKEQAQ